MSEPEALAEEGCNNSSALSTTPNFYFIWESWKSALPLTSPECSDEGDALTKATP
jgi:hypothetical protein